MERQQLKWVAYAGVLPIGSFLLVSLLEGREIAAPVQLAVDISFFVLGVLGVSTAVAASSGASTGASTAAATTPPGRSRSSAPASARS